MTASVTTKSTPEQRQYWKDYYERNKEKKKAAAIAHGRVYYATNRDRIKQVHHAYYVKNKDLICERTSKNRRPETSSIYNRRQQIKRYGLTPEQYIDLFEAQGGVCAICGSPDTAGKNWHIDHCHKTGKTRGILCQGCNLGLGNFRDDVDRLHLAVAYLIHWKDK